MIHHLHSKVKNKEGENWRRGTDHRNRQPAITVQQSRHCRYLWARAQKEKGMAHTRVFTTHLSGITRCIRIQPWCWTYHPYKPTGAEWAAAVFTQPCLYRKIHFFDFYTHFLVRGVFKICKSFLFIHFGYSGNDIPYKENISLTRFFFFFFFFTSKYQAFHLHQDTPHWCLWWLFYLLPPSKNGLKIG
jgi:hypothetical protein